MILSIFGFWFIRKRWYQFVGDEETIEQKQKKTPWMCNMFLVFGSYLHPYQHIHINKYIMFVSYTLAIISLMQHEKYQINQIGKTQTHHFNLNTQHICTYMYILITVENPCS